MSDIPYRSGFAKLSFFNLTAVPGRFPFRRFLPTSKEQSKKQATALAVLGLAFFLSLIL